ncbi:MAG: hypothetical protein C0623_07945 [Desulfuromonas sp.]|nr:MAG: hypothetical protein C0623_07945 [Desulfuromonas sp.]
MLNSFNKLSFGWNPFRANTIRVNITQSFRERYVMGLKDIKTALKGDTMNSLRSFGCGVFCCLVFTAIFLSAPIAEAKIGSIGTATCSTTGCHPITTGSAVDQVAVKPGAAAWETFSGTTAATVSSSVNAGDTIELEWVWTALNDKKGNTGASIAIPNTTPSTWIFTPNTNPGAGGLTLWNATYQSTTWYGGATPTLLSSHVGTHDGYCTDYTTSTIANLDTGGLAIDNPGPDNQAARMGAKVSVTVPADTPGGNYTIMVHGVGHVGNAKQSKITTLTITVAAAADTTAPSVTAITPANVDYNGTHVDASFDLSASITEANTLSTCEYQVNAGAWTAATVGGSAPNWTCTVTGGLGPYADTTALALNFRGTDDSANTGTGTAINRTVDASAPATTDNAPAGWQNANPTVTLTSGDGGGSGVASTEYCIDTNNTCTPGTAGTSATTTIGAGAAGTQYIRYRSTDNVGNVEAIKSTGAIQIDRALPSSTISAPTGGTFLRAADFPYTISGTATDGTGSGVALVEVDINVAGTWPDATGTTNWTYSWAQPADGSYTIQSRATDSASPTGNTETPGAGVTVTVDTTAPTVSSTVPADAATDVATNTTVTINFTDANLDCTTVTTGTVTSAMPGWTRDSCTEGTGVAVFSTSGLANSTSYSFTITTGVQDKAGNAFAADQTVTFDTVAAGNSPPNVPTGPAQYESDGSTAISVGGYSTTTTLVFEADLSDPDGDTVKLQIDYTGDNASDCESALVASGTNNVQVTCAGLTDGNSYNWQYRAVDSNSAPSAWVSFAGTPDFTVDATAPSVSSTVPTNSATGVALDGNVTINFSENIDCATVNTTNVTSDSPGWTFSSCSAAQAVFTTSGQANSTTYNVSVTGAITDLAGNPLNAAPYIFSYTTAAAAGVDSTTVGVASATPGNTVINVNVPYSDDDNTDNTILVEWGLDGIDFSLGSNAPAPTHPASPYTYEINSLSNGTAYQVRITYTDGDGVTGTNPQIITGITPVATNPLLHNSISTASDKWGAGGWGITGGQYGEFTCGTCHSASKADLDNGTDFNIKRVKATITAPTGTWDSTGLATVDVRFTDANDAPTGVGFGDDTGGHANSNKVCEACHTQNKFHNYDTADNTANGGDLAHENNRDCMVCHKHDNGFDAACDTCHGNPPTASTLGGPTGLANDPFATASATAGAHQKHALDLAYTCSNCHDGYVMPQESTAKPGFGDVSISFNNFGVTTGSYSGQAGVSYNDVLGTGGENCTNIYCHSTGQSADGTSATPSSYSTASWSTPASGACGTCHDDLDPATGSHTAHVNDGAACNDCHSCNNHVDHNIDVTSGTYTAGGAPGNNYGTCSTASCHDDGTGTLATTPAWGTATTDCTECHAGAAISTGSHGAHIAAGETCSGCHDAATDPATETEPVAGHRDTNIDTQVALGYTQNKTKGSGYETCATASCHNDGRNSGLTNVWGTTLNNCSECHATQPATGGHGAHIGVSFAGSAIGCGDCHTNAVEGTTAPTGHRDGNIDAFGYDTANKTLGTAFTTCTTATCHQTGQAVNDYTTTSVWGTNDANCTQCHEASPTTNSHAKHIAVTSDCATCHTNAVINTSYADANHGDLNIDVTVGGYTANKAIASALESCSINCHSDGINAVGTSPTWGTAGGACDVCHLSDMTTGSHGPHLSDGAVCGDCHDGAVKDSNAGTAHTDGNVDVIATYATATAAYGIATWTTCSAASCHDDGRAPNVTADWGTTINNCAECHATQPATGSHAAHLADGATCGDCHTG